jgi:maltose O-acetyltransferase
VRFFNDKYINGLLQPPIVGDMVRIGGGALILPGVKISSNAFIGAGALITKDVPEGITVIGKW